MKMGGKRKESVTEGIELLLAEVDRLIVRDKRALKDVPIDDGARETVERRLDVLRSIARDCRRRLETMTTKHKEACLSG